MCTEFVACLQVAVEIGRRTQWSKLEGTSDCLESYLNGTNMGNPNDPWFLHLRWPVLDDFGVHHETQQRLQLHLHLILIDMALSVLIAILGEGEDHDQLNICKLVTSKCPVWTSDVSFPEISRTSWTAGFMCWFLEPQPETCCQIGSDSSMPSTIQPPFCPKAYSI